MQLVKPEPLIIGGRPHYTLTSYDPVHVEVDVPFIADEEVDEAILSAVEDAGGSKADLQNDVWIAEHFTSIRNADELRAAMDQELRMMVAQMTEEEKVSRCLEVLAARLVQDVLPQAVDEMREAASQRLEMSLAQDGLSLSQFYAQTGMTAAQMQTALDVQAKEMAEQDAAVAAWADQRKVQVDDSEIPQLVGLPPEQADLVIAQIKAQGQFEQLRRTARQGKAIALIVTEADCTYRNETPEEARIRRAQMRAQEAGSGLSDAEDQGPTLKLV